MTAEILKSTYELPHEAMEEAVAMMLACKTHLGTQNVEEKMIPYVYGKTIDGANNIINLGMTYKKLMVAARMLVAIENPSDIVVVSARPYGSRPTMKFAHYTGAQCVAGKWVPGTLTNHQITKKFMEPRILFVTDPRADFQAVRESAYANIPVIALCNTDAVLRNVDLVIPCNNKSIQSIALMYWLLAREILYLRQELPRESAWKVMPDMFFWKDPEQAKEEEAAPSPAAAETEAPPRPQVTVPDYSLPATAAPDEWDSVNVKPW